MLSAFDQPSKLTSSPVIWELEKEKCSDSPKDLFLGSGSKAAGSSIQVSAIKRSPLHSGWQLSCYSIQDVFLPECIVSESFH